MAGRATQTGDGVASVADKELTFEDFRRLAQDSTLSPYQKIGFPDSYREGQEEGIFADIRAKLTNLAKPGQVVLDIGPGCSTLPRLLIELCRTNGHTLILVDSAEMLDQLPDAPFIHKLPGYYPDCPTLFEQYNGRLDAILSYSVLHYIFNEGNIFTFLDSTMGLLADGGQILLGDIPNISKRKRFFSSPNGIRFHQQFIGTDETPVVEFNRLEEGKIDDAALVGMLLRCRQAGFEAFIVPQPEDLPMANRREDFLIIKP